MRRLRTLVAALLAAGVLTFGTVTPAGAAPPTGMSNPAFGLNADGRLEAFAVKGGAVWHNYQWGSGWAGWSSLGGPSGGIWGAPVVVNNGPANGPRPLEAFAISNLGVLYHSKQDGSGATGWSAWTQLAWFNRVYGLSAKTDDFGISVVVTADDDVWKYTSYDGAWQSQNLGRPAADVPLTGDVEFARNADGRREVFAASLYGTVFHKWELPGGGWSGWVALDHNQCGTPNALSVATNQDTRLELFTNSSTGAGGADLCHLWQDNNQDGGWSGWNNFGDGTLRTGNDSITALADGAQRIEVYGMRTNGTLVGKWQQQPNANWSSGLTQIGTGFDATFALGSNGDGRLELLAFRSGVAYHTWQATPGGTWHAWQLLDQG